MRCFATTSYVCHLSFHISDKFPPMISPLKEHDNEIFTPRNGLLPSHLFDIWILIKLDVQFQELYARLCVADYGGESMVCIFHCVDLQLTVSVMRGVVFCLKNCWKFCIVGNLYAFDASRNRVWFGAESLFMTFCFVYESTENTKIPLKKNLFSLLANPSFILVLLFSFFAYIFGKI